MDELVSRALALAEESYLAGTGPGGQNVNKVATNVQLRLDVYAVGFEPQVRGGLPIDRDDDLPQCLGGAGKAVGSACGGMHDHVHAQALRISGQRHARKQVFYARFDGQAGIEIRGASHGRTMAEVDPTDKGLAARPFGSARVLRTPIALRQQDK